MTSPEPSVDLVVRGDLVLPDRVVPAGYLTVTDGRISQVLPGTDPQPPGPLLDASGCLVLPGAIDAHVHSYSYRGEGFRAATTAAAAGGVTTIIEMPYDDPQPVNSVDALRAKRQRLDEEAVVDVALLGTLPKSGGLDQIPLLAEEGVCGFKLSMLETHPDRFPRIPDGELLDAFRLIAETGLTVGLHAEDGEIIARLVRRYAEAGKSYPQAHCETRPPVAESVAVLTALEFAAATGAAVHMYHASLKRCFDHVAAFKRQGVNATAETCPHYLLLAQEDMDRLGGYGKINPPLRPRSEVERLWDALQSGSVDMVASDHAPWPRSMKGHPDIFRNASGTPGVETLLPLMYSEAAATGRIGIVDLARLLSEGPARRFGLWPRKGHLAPGADADLVVLDPAARSVLDEERLHSNAGWSPYQGRPLSGEVVATLVRGRQVHQRGTVVGKPGWGRFIRHHALGRRHRSGTRAIEGEDRTT
jgi:allantoinase